MPTVISTSTTSTATQAFNQRKLDRNQDGTLWSFHNTDASTVTPRYSKDNGATWTAATALTGLTNASLFIDLDDYAHVVWLQSGTTGPTGVTVQNGQIWHMRGTPNAGRTTWTFSTPTQVSSASNQSNFADVVAYRDPVGGWSVPIVASLNNGTNTTTLYSRIRIATDGSVTTSTDGLFTTNDALMGSLGADYATNVHTFPSIDFNHTGDGKTVAGGTPHLFVGWTAGATGVGRGVRFRKAVYAAGAWTWNAEREIDNARFLPSTLAGAVCQFDGTRVSFAGEFYDGTNYDLLIYDRDAGDTMTTTTLLFDNATSANLLHGGSASYDNEGNVYLFGRDGSGVNDTRLLNYRKWTRSGASLGPIVTFDTTGPDNPFISAQRGYSGSAVRWVYTDGTTSPYSVAYDKINLNFAPNAPALSIPSVVDRAQDVTVGVAFSDPNAGDTSSSSAIRFRRTDISPAFTVITVAAPVSGVTIPGGTLAAAPYEVQGQSRDAQGLTGPWSASSFFTAGNRPPGPTFITPGAGDTITVPTQTFTFSQPSLTSFQWRVVGDTAGAPDESVIINAGATVITPTGRSFTVTGLPNTTTIQTQVRVTDGGIDSPWSSLRNLVSFTPPSVSTLALTVSYSTASITSAITNPAPGAGQPTVTSHDLYRREGGVGEGIRIAKTLVAGSTFTDRTVASGVDYSYRAVSTATNGTTSTSAWVTDAGGYAPGTPGVYTATYAATY